MTVYYLGIDPGLQGAFALIAESGRLVQLHDMPCIRGQASTGNYDPPGVLSLLRKLTRIPGVQVGVEWPQTRPGEGAQRSRNFGLGLAYLEMSCIALRCDYQKIDPQKWKNRFGLPGKKHDKGLQQHLTVFDTYFPDCRGRISGPRGGIRDGRLEACLIAEYMRRKTFGGMKATVERFGKDSVEAMAMVLGGGRRKRK